MAAEKGLAVVTAFFVGAVLYFGADAPNDWALSLAGGALVALGVALLAYLWVRTLRASARSPRPPEGGA